MIIQFYKTYFNFFLNNHHQSIVSFIVGNLLNFIEQKCILILYFYNDDTYIFSSAYLKILINDNFSLLLSF